MNKYITQNDKQISNSINFFKAIWTISISALALDINYPSTFLIAARSSSYVSYAGSSG